MSYEQVGNNSLDSQVPQELVELDMEFAALAADFDLESSEGNGATADLDDLIAGTELEPIGTESTTGGGLSLLDIADRVGTGDDAEFLGKIWDKVSKPIANFVKNKASRLIRKLIALVRKYSKLASCVPKVMLAVAAFKAKKWGTALKLAYVAYRCIKSKM